MPPGGRPQGPTPDNPIKLFLADVDGTLVTPDKELTQKAIEAVHALRDADVLFAITSAARRGAWRCWSNRSGSPHPSRPSTAA